MKLLLDTNALIDFIADRKPYASDIRKLCIASSFGDVQLWMSTQSFADAFYVLRKNAPMKNVKQALLNSLQFFIPCGTYASDLQPALESEWPDIEDYLIAHSTRHINAQFIITRDVEMMSRCPTPAMTAASFLDYLEQDHGLVYDDVPF